VVPGEGGGFSAKLSGMVAYLGKESSGMRVFDSLESSSVRGAVARERGNVSSGVGWGGKSRHWDRTRTRPAGHVLGAGVRALDRYEACVGFQGKDAGMCGRELGNWAEFVDGATISGRSLRRISYDCEKGDYQMGNASEAIA